MAAALLQNVTEAPRCCSLLPLATDPETTRRGHDSDDREMVYHVEVMFHAGHGPRDGRSMMYDGAGRRASLDNAVRSDSTAVRRSPPRRSRWTSTVTQSVPMTRHGRRSLRRAPHPAYHFLHKRTRSFTRRTIEGTQRVRTNVILLLP